MKVLVVSDTHGREDNLKKVLDKYETFDLMIHLGDMGESEQHIREMAGCPVYMVCGNCDTFSNLPDSAIVKIPGHRIMITHGHIYYVGNDTRRLAREAKNLNCDIAMFGHTHVPYFDRTDPDLTILNPGSISYPRQFGHRPGYLIAEFDEDGNSSFKQYFL